MADASAFNRGMDQWLQAAVQRADQRMQAIVTEAFNRIVARTPVDTGFLRANWRIVVNGSPPQGTIQNTRDTIFSTPPSVPITSLSVKAGDIAIIYNRTEYARYVEEGTSRMPGRHMVRLTIMEMRAKYGSIIAAPSGGRTSNGRVTAAVSMRGKGRGA